MRFTTQDPDIETIVRRITEGDYDLQPEFQRGDVWPTAKQQRLVDSILRGWHIPPVHLVGREAGFSDVLDGQQRLTAIRDFLRDDFPINGNIDPFDPGILALHGKRFSQLPSNVQKRIKRFTIRVFELDDYNPDEPHELFFRLNQPTSLTEAEKRNAFIGAPRNQVKKLVDYAIECGMTPERIGFSNARMAYDDLLARALLTLEARSLDVKVTAGRVTERYRSPEPFSSTVVNAMQDSVRTFFALPSLGSSPRRIRPNRATIHTWLCTGAQLSMTDSLGAGWPEVSPVLERLEEWRWERPRTNDVTLLELLLVFQDRSTARVADVSSVLIRDLILWMVIGQRNESAIPISPKVEVARPLWNRLDFERDFDSQLSEFAIASGWGSLGWG